MSVVMFVCPKFVWCNYAKLCYTLVTESTSSLRRSAVILVVRRALKHAKQLHHSRKTPG